MKKCLLLLIFMSATSCAMDTQGKAEQPLNEDDAEKQYIKQWSELLALIGANKLFAGRKTLKKIETTVNTLLDEQTNFKKVVRTKSKSSEPCGDTLQSSSFMYNGGRSSFSAPSQAYYPGQVEQQPQDDAINALIKKRGKLLALIRKNKLFAGKKTLNEIEKTVKELLDDETKRIKVARTESKLSESTEQQSQPVPVYAATSTPSIYGSMPQTFQHAPYQE